MEESVTLVVKAPNQQIDDQTIHCETNWSVKTLKEHLSRVYPSKPRLEDQKLIYSGQLLTDNSILKDVLRSYEGQENHILHLVCSPPRESMKSAASSTTKKTPTPSPTPSGTQNPAGSSGGASSSATTTNPGLRHRGQGQGQAYAWPYTSSAQPAAPVWSMYGTYDAANMAQQMAYMQQAYVQYMTQYMQLMATGNVAAMGMPQMNAVPPASVPPPLREDPQPANVPAPNQEDPDDPRANRDWLDWFYVLSRMMVLFVIVYFYSSPVRFFVVSTLGICMYLYQVGFFRAMQRLDQQEEVPQTPPPTPDNNNTPAPEPETPPPPPPAPSPLALTWAAFSSFFLSLIPEQPNVL